MLPHLVAPHTLKRAMAPRMEAWMARTEPSATLPLDIDIRVYEYRNRQRVDGQDLYIYEESR